MASIHGPSPRFDLERCEQLTRMMAISLSRGNFEAAQRQLTDAINDLTENPNKPKTNALAELVEMRLANALDSIGIIYVEQLATISKNQFFELPNISFQSFKKIEKVMRPFSIEFKPDLSQATAEYDNQTN